MQKKDRKQEERKRDHEEHDLASKVEGVLPEKGKKEAKRLAYTVEFRRSALLIPVGIFLFGVTLLLVSPFLGIPLALQFLGGVLAIMGVLASLGIGIVLVNLKKRAEQASEQKTQAALRILKDKRKSEEKEEIREEE